MTIRLSRPALSSPGGGGDDRALGPQVPARNEEERVGMRTIMRTNDRVSIAVRTNDRILFYRWDSMGKFVARFVRISSGRENRVTVYAGTHLEAFEKLRADADVGNVLSLEEEFEPATDRQIAYLRDLLGHEPPSGMSKGGASDMITELVDRRREEEFAENDFQDDVYGEAFELDNISHKPALRKENAPKWLLPVVLLVVLGILSRCAG